MPVALPIQITFDCTDADRLAEFWALALDYELQGPPPGYESWEALFEEQGWDLPEPGSISAVVDPAGVGPRLLFQRVPESKSAKNRMHLDVAPGDDEAKLAKVRQLVEAGGTEVRRVDDQTGWWIVMRDPEGNEFCVH